MTVRIRSIATKPDTASSRPWKPRWLAILPTIPQPQAANHWTKGTPDRKEKDSMQPFEKTSSNQHMGQIKGQQTDEDKTMDGSEEPHIGISP